MATTREIKKAVQRIFDEVNEHAGSDKAHDAARALILAVPLRKSKAPSRTEMREALLRERGEDDRQYVNDAVKSGRAGAFVRADDVVRYGVFEGDLILIHGGKFGGTENLGETITLRPDDLNLSDAEAVDGNMEHWPIERAADGIIMSYAFGEEGGGVRGPWFPVPRRGGRY